MRHESQTASPVLTTLNLFAVSGFLMFMFMV